MGFWQQQLQVIEPLAVPAEYGNSTTWNYDVEPVDLPFLVDLQPVSMVRMPDGSRVDPTETRYRFFTPVGFDIAVKKQQRYRWLDQVFDVDAFRRWPSSDYPSGVDHVVVDLVLREG